MAREETSRASAVLALAIVFLIVSSGSMFGHHGTAVSYHQDQELVIKGIVTEFAWRNPHSSLYLDVTEGPFAGQNYAVELNSPGVMLRWGWTRSVFKPGDELTLTVNPSKTGRAVGECLNCTVLINGAEIVEPR